MIPLLVGVAFTIATVLQPRPGHAQYVHSSTLTAPTTNAGAEFGAAVAGVGDVDADGTADVLVGAPGDSVGGDNAGKAFLFSGADGSHLRTFESPNAEQLGLFGDALAGVGDLNGDGTPDVAITAQGEAVQDEDSAGRVYVFSGEDGRVLHALASPNAESYGHFGAAVAGLGDLNEDGTPDLVVGARGETVDGSSRAGRLYVVSGAEGRVLNSVTSGAPDGLGKAVSVLRSGAGAEEMELFVGANLATVQDDERAGRAYRITGSDLTIQQTFVSPQPEENGHFGGVISGLGDVTDDDVPEVIAGAELETVNGRENAGRAYLLDGAEGRVLHSFEAPNPRADARVGFSAIGIEEAPEPSPVVVVAERPPIHERAATENPDPGQVYVFGTTDGELLQTLTSPNAEERGGFGSALTPLGGGVAVGAEGESVDGSENAGRVYLYSPKSK